MAIKKVTGATRKQGSTKKKTNVKTIQSSELKTKGNGYITFKKVKEIAKLKGINSHKMKKAEIIKNIQRTEGNFDCFGTATAGYCDQNVCLWITECLNP